MELMICSKRHKGCRKEGCKGAYAHKCENYNETHGCTMYISQPFCKPVQQKKNNEA